MFTNASRRTHNRLLRIPLILLCLLLFCPAAIHAEGGDGQGGGSGEHKDIPLTLAASSVTDGQTGVPVNVTIELDFNKNVCNVTELENNRRCIHLSGEDGTSVPARLIFPDTQVQRELRHEVFVQPAQDLEANTVYRVTIDAGLQAKNGTFLDRSYRLTFTTGADRTDAVNEKLAGLGDFIVTFDASDAAPSGSNVAPSDGPSDGPSEGSSEGPDLPLISVLAAVLLLAAAAAFTLIVLRLRRSRK